ncbi:MAG: peptidylprolyl isomerase [Gammaproteobacteria bacterium]
MSAKRFLSALPLSLIFGAAVAVAAPPPSPVPLSGPPKVEIITTEGNIVVQLNPQRAPLTVKNFLTYVKSGFYDGTIFHRVIPGFVIQGGSMTTDYKQKKTRAPIPNESGNGLSNRRGTIAMAREANPHSATAGFYINLADNTKLDPRPDRWGYAVFGRVVSGMKVVDKIASVPTGPAGPLARNAPQAPIIIKKIVLVKSGSAQ